MKIFLTTSEGTKEITNMVTDATLSGDYQTAYTAMREHISYVNLTVKYG